MLNPANKKKASLNIQLIMYYKDEINGYYNYCKEIDVREKYTADEQGIVIEDRKINADEQGRKDVN